ncbi:MAG: circularly permuted type 2 ATP-grasp protein, partial [Verrucomicrobiales bacterium]
LRAQTVHSLQPFISAYSETIAALAPRDIDDPHVVLLTPGPHNETYFEHSYLARTLGFPLVEGDDLTVRDGRVFLKSISGLRQVDVIVRRLDSDWCDPLELRGDSLLGIPGLLQAIRSGQVAVANAVGSGLAQSPAITAFLQSLSQQLLGEDLKIPSVATWWCGQERERRYVLDNLASLVIKPAKKPGTHPAILASQLSAAELDTWRRRIERTPDDWCAQEFVDRATTPALRDGRLEPSRFLLRVFMVRSGGRYRLLPGGMARVSGAPGFSMSMQYGAVSKDVWVVGESAAVQRSSGPPVRQGAHLLRRSTHSLPSRTADNLFWLGRYLERVEFKARVARTLVDALMDEAAFSAADSIAPVFGVLCPGCDLKSLRRRNALNLSACENLLDQWFNGVLPFGGLRADVESAVRIARSVKERLSLETWNSLAAAAQSEGALSQNPGVVISDHTVKSLDRTITLLSSISGLFMENMTRGDGWLFQDLGRRIERGAQLCRLLSTAIVPPARDEESMLRLLLRCADSLITYRRRYFTQIYSLAVLDLLLFDACNPRSMAFQIGEISSHLDGLPHRQQPKAAPLPMDQTALRLVSQIGLDEAKHLDGQVRGRRKDLAKFLEELAGHFGTLSAQIGDHYFAITRSQPSAARDPFADRF